MLRIVFSVECFKLWNGTAKSCGTYCFQLFYLLVANKLLFHLNLVYAAEMCLHVFYACNQSMHVYVDWILSDCTLQQALLS